MKIVLVTDAWLPQINGVVRTLTQLRDQLLARGHEVHVIAPDLFPTVPLPTYAEIRLAVGADAKVGRMLWEFDPDAVHIATEGPLGLAARRYCIRRRLRFTTSFHTRFPEYVKQRLPFLPLSPGYAMVRWFHDAAARTMVSTPELRDELHGRGFGNLVLWSRGVDTELFRPLGKSALDGPGPRFMYMGRVAPEKNIEAFLQASLPGSKYVVGDGPARLELQRRYPQVTFTGAKSGEDLARHLSAADCFVFPSRTDTLGLVVMEAMACGVPVASYPVSGPASMIRQGVTGVMDEDLATAARAALALDPAACRRYAESLSLAASTEQFLGNLVPARPRVDISVLEPVYSRRQEA